MRKTDGSDMAKAGRIPRGHFEPEVYLDGGESADTVARLRTVAAGLSLPPSHGWMPPDRVWRPTVDDVVIASESIDDAFPDSSLASRIEPISGAKEVAELRSHLQASENPDWKRWHLKGNLNPLVKHAGEPSMLGLKATRPGKRKAEGVLVASRWLYVQPKMGDETVSEIEYVVNMDFIFVRPEARGELQSKALVAAAGRQVRYDLEFLKQGLGKFTDPPALRTRVTGEAHSEEGLIALDDMAAALDEITNEVFGDEIECDRDYSL